MDPEYDYEDELALEEFSEEMAELERMVEDDAEFGGWDADDALARYAHETGAVSFSGGVSGALKAALTSASPAVVAKKKTANLIVRPTRKNLGKLTSMKRQQTLKVPAGMRRQFQKAKLMDNMVRNHDMQYIHAHGGTVISSSLGTPYKKLRPAETSALQTQLFTGRAVEPRVLNFVTVGANQVLDLEDVNQGLELVPFLGYLLTMEASTLNMIPGGDFTVITRSRVMDPTSIVPADQTVMTQTYRIAPGENVMHIMCINACLRGGLPRLAGGATVVTGAALPDPFTGIIVTGTPTNYVPKVRLLLPGDSVVERFISLL